MGYNIISRFGLFRLCRLICNESPNDAQQQTGDVHRQTAFGVLVLYTIYELDNQFKFNSHKIVLKTISGLRQE